MSLKNINNPHDKFVKAMLSEKDIAIAFLESNLPISLKELIDLDTISYPNTNYITTELEGYFSDMVLRFQLKHQKVSCQISLLIEHKSKREKYTEFQIMTYLANAYSTQIRDNKKSRSQIELILPMVYYHGEQKWKLRKLSSYFSQYNDAVLAYIPNFDIHLVSLFSMSDEEIQNLKHGLLCSAFMIQKYQHDPNGLVSNFIRILESIKPYEERNFTTSIIVYFLELSEIKEIEILDIINSESITNIDKNKIMSTYDMILEKGVEKGIEQGIKKGIEKGVKQNVVDVITRCIKKGYSLNEISEITGLNENQIVQIIDELQA